MPCFQSDNSYITDVFEFRIVQQKYLTIYHAPIYSRPTTEPWVKRSHNRQNRKI